jgi:hypothetical protein
MRGNIIRDLFEPSTRGKRSNDSKKRGFIPFSSMERNLIRTAASVTRTDKPFKEVRKSNIILRKVMVV